MAVFADRIQRAALKVNLRAVLTIGAAGLPLALLLVAVLVAQQITNGNAVNQNLLRLSQAATQPRMVYSLLQDAESGQRGYLLTGRRAYLEPYDKSVAAMPAALKRLDLLAAADPGVAPQMAQLRSDAQIKLKELATTIALHDAGRQQEALDIVESGVGQNLMNDIRDTMARMRPRLANLIASQTAEHDRSMERTGELVGALLISIAAFAIFSASVIMANLKERERIVIDKEHTESERAQLVEQLDAERKRLIQMVRELEIAKYQADQANKAKSEFLASMSHELRTPLNAILGFSEVIRDELFGPVGLSKYVDYASDVHKSGQLLLDLINDVLDLSKIDAGKVELREEILSVPELIQDCIVLVRERALKGGVALTLMPIEPEPHIVGDARLLKQVLLNLLSNAIKFTSQGGSVTVTAAARKDDYAITVSDTGIGMTPDDIQKAMSAYGQVDSKIARKHRGTGLGLPISRSLAELHGGALNIKSVPQHGTDIELILPGSRLVRGTSRKRA